ncbi:MAG TPA: lytic transglycosylase domain-containing protein [Candidatus Binataceae bacterium]|nr:lytic transglycosylase domain-containing protein [Candidatus Binataceae bacterium]
MLERLRRRLIGVMLGVAASLAVMSLAGATSCQAAAQLPFPRPAFIEPNIQFWVDVFATYSVRDFAIVDRDKVSRIYQVYHLPGDGIPTRDDVDWVNVYLKSKYSDLLQHLAAGHQPETAEERRVAEMFKGESLSAYSIAADNLRVQEGLRERFREGLVRSRYYRPTMERIFRQAGLPPELVTLAQVESGFQTHAKSSAGAYGIWQFTRATGAKYMKISRHHDDRFNPIRSTEAAAKLLRSNYDQLGDWALAITAYNYGTGGIARAADLYEGDYATMIERYQGPHFGFAVKNYYAEFLAAMDVYENEETYFPGIKDDVANLAAEETESESDEEAPRHSTRSHKARHHGAVHHHHHHLRRASA